MQSMTGYGRKTVGNELITITLEAVAVNRKNLEVVSSAPKEWVHFDRFALECAKKRFHRGRIQLQLKIETAEGAIAQTDWDEKLVLERLKAFKELCSKVGIECKVTEELMVSLLRLPGMEPGVPEWSDVESLLLEGIEGTFEELLSMREKEGLALKNDLTTRLGTLQNYALEMQKLAPQVAPAHRKALFDRLAQAELDIDPDDERVMKEISLFVDRSDISEELTRLNSHFDQLRQTLDSDEAIGRKIDFMLQEIFREFNTIGSKANNFEISQQVIAAKNELERFREQVQNIE
jgi:uncharacterized protein (TIGR00255 family)